MPIDPKIIEDLADRICDQYFGGAKLPEKGADWRKELRAIVIEEAAAKFFSNQRLFDLVRQQRSELHTADLISDDEYAILAQEHAAVARLEDYDAIKRRPAQLKELLRDIAQRRHRLAGSSAVVHRESESFETCGDDVCKKVQEALNEHTRL